VHNSRSSNILITGSPGIGKTTLVKKVADGLHHLTPVGFYTQEIRRCGRRLGFELIGFNGCRAVLAHVDIKGPHRVGRYGVDLDGFEDFLAPYFRARNQTSVYIIDEIGKMECFSRSFEDWIKNLLDSDSLVIATLSQKGSGLISQCHSRRDAVRFEVTRKNRDRLLADILSLLP
jgi:nucleoside-triphosphatase